MQGSSLDGPLEETPPRMPPRGGFCRTRGCLAPESLVKKSNGFCVDCTMALEAAPPQPLRSPPQATRAGPPARAPFNENDWRRTDKMGGGGSSGGGQPRAADDDSVGSSAGMSRHVGFASFNEYRAHPASDDAYSREPSDKRPLSNRAGAAMAPRAVRPAPDPTSAAARLMAAQRADASSAAYGGPEASAMRAEASRLEVLSALAREDRELKVVNWSDELLAWFCSYCLHTTVTRYGCFNLGSILSLTRAPL